MLLRLPKVQKPVEVQIANEIREDTTVGKEAE